MKRRDRRQRSPNISSSRWVAYAVAGLATASGGAISAEGAIHYSGPVHLRLDGQQSFSFNLLPLSGGAYLEFRRNVTPSYGASDTLRVLGILAGSVRVRRPADLFAAKLHRNQNVSSGVFQVLDVPLIRANEGAFDAVGIGFAGFKFDVGKGDQYGWARIRTVVAGSHNRLAVVDYAWADPGEPIVTGQTSSDIANPDQGSLGLLALGAAGLAAWRRSRFGRVGSAAF